MLRKTLLAAMLLSITLSVSGCGAVTEYLAALPTDTTLVFVPSRSKNTQEAIDDKTTCLAIAHEKASVAKNNRILPRVAEQALSVAAGAAGGAIVGSAFGRGHGGFAGTGAALGATAGGVAAGTVGGYLAYLSGDNPDQAVFDAAFAKCAEEHGHTVRFPGDGQSGPPPGVRF